MKLKLCSNMGWFWNPSIVGRGRNFLPPVIEALRDKISVYLEKKAVLRLKNGPRLVTDGDRACTWWMKRDDQWKDVTSNQISFLSFLQVQNRFRPPCQLESQNSRSILSTYNSTTAKTVPKHVTLPWPLPIKNINQTPNKCHPVKLPMRFLA
jgi:hypothetical protein